MMHPLTRLEHIDDRIGLGVFASSTIPAGTITYVRDTLDIVINDSDERLLNTEYYQVLDTYTYRESNGDYVLGWDHSRFVNHSCTANTLSTGYGFEIAIRDIHPGEQVTDDYGLHNVNIPMECECGQPGCRWIIKASDFDLYRRYWDSLLIEVLPRIPAVDQPLQHHIDADTWSDLLHFLETGNHYRSVAGLRYRKPPELIAS